MSSCHCGEKLFSQTFTYDPLNRLTANTLGGVANQSWNLDSQGNWSSVTTNGVTQTETANAQNQITSISGTAGTPVYDANGNMTTDQSGNTYVYNAWNQLVSVSNASGQVIAQYTYDAMGYRVTESYPLGGNGVAAGTVNYIYYDSQWQAIETRTNGTAASNVTSQMVWSASYINAAILQETYSGGTLQANSRFYFEQDANWDTTAVVGFNSTAGTWNVVQRFTYSPYGTITILNADWSTPSSGTQPLVNNLYQGMTLDAVTGLYYERERNYSPSLGIWISQDPAGYINGANTYQFVMSNPVENADVQGLAFGHHILPSQVFNSIGVNANSPGGQYLKNLFTGATDPPHGWSKLHGAYNNAVQKLVDNWLRNHPDVNPKCPKFSETDAKAIADDILESDDPGIRNLLRDVLNSVAKPSQNFQQIANTFQDANGDAIATAKPAPPSVVNATQNVSNAVSTGAAQNETLGQEVTGFLQEAESTIEADAAEVEQQIELVPK